MHKPKRVNLLFSLKNTYRKDTRRETLEIAAITDAFSSFIAEKEAYRAGKIYKTIETMTSNRRLEFSYCHYSSLIEHVSIAKSQKKKVLISNFQVKNLESNYKTCCSFDDEQIAVNLFMPKVSGSVS